MASGVQSTRGEQQRGQRQRQREREQEQEQERRWRQEQEQQEQQSETAANGAADNEDVIAADGAASGTRAGCASASERAVALPKSLLLADGLRDDVPPPPSLTPTLSEPSSQRPRPLTADSAGGVARPGWIARVLPVARSRMSASSRARTAPPLSLAPHRV
jgi:hypothetical protein